MKQIGAQDPDRAEAGREVATVTGGNGNDSLVGTGSADKIYGYDGDDQLFGGAGNDSLYGGNDDDTLQGGAGRDSLDGGSGIDTADYSTSGAGVSVNLGTGAASGGDAAGDRFKSIENLIGSDYADTLTGTSGSNTLAGGAGNDQLYGGSGSDVLYGGDGDDTLNGGADADTLDGGAGNDLLDYAASSAAVQVNLANGTAAGGDAAGDSFTNIEGLIGSAYNDVLTGNSGANTIYGGGGNDTISGGAGADYLDGGGSSGDLVDYSASSAGVSVNLAIGVASGGDAAGDTLVGFNNITGSNLNDTLVGNANANQLYGGDGNDSLDGGAGNDLLYGGAGNDTLKGGAGADRLEGGAGIDLADYSGSSSGVNVTVNGTGSGGDAAGDTLTGIENLQGSSYNDTLTGDDGNNYLYGGAGNDALYGGIGDDTLAGGAGADTLNGGEGMDFVDYSASASAVSVNLNTWTALYGDAQGDQLTGVDGIIGSAFNDTLIGFDQQGLSGDVYTNIFYGGAGSDYIDGMGANDNLYGGADNDTILGGSGDDLTDGGDGNDLLYGGTGNDTMDGGAGNDTLSGGDGQDLGYGGTGNDSIAGDAGNDSLYGGDGDDSIDGGADNDQLFGGSGNDTLLGGTGNDSLDGGTGNDILFGGAGNDTLYGGVGSDSLDGGTGNDLLDGGVGNDTLFGGAGNDTLYAGDGNDALYGGDGIDHLYGGDGNDTLGGGAGDIIDGGAGHDSLDLTGQAPFRIWRDPLNPLNGTVQFLDGLGNVIGTLAFSNIETVVSCFTPGTRIATRRGAVAVENLRLGDLVLTRDHGAQAIRWIGRRSLGLGELLADPLLQPVRIAKGALGNGLPERDMLLSRQHRMLLCGSGAQLLFGSDEVLVRAAHLVGLPGITEAAQREVTYLHVMFDRHEVILADGAWSESFQPGDRSLSGLEADQRDELLKIFPQLGQGAVVPQFDAARLTLKSYEARLLLGLGGANLAPTQKAPIVGGLRMKQVA